MAQSVLWNTNIMDPNIKKIFALSDIHGDMHALIVALRDCAKVIRKKTNPTDPNKLDPETEQLLELNLNTQESQYRNDLNYEWCENNVHVVICGDILDSYRNKKTNYRKGGINSICPQDTKNNTEGCIASEYPQIEIKIYRFINALNEQPNRNGCIIHKILGNHELWNMSNEPDVLEIVKDYIAPETHKLGKDYYGGLSRLEYFLYGNPGFYLIFKGGAGIFLKINNNIFVHGQLDHTVTYESYYGINRTLNTPESHLIVELLQRLSYKGDYNTTLTERFYDRYYTTNSNNNIYNGFQFTKCKDVKENLKELLDEIVGNTYKPEEMRIIVGHCPQYFHTHVLNSSFTDYKLDNTVEKLSGNVRTSFKNPKENFVFGIGMECDKENLDEKYEGYEKYSQMHLKAAFLAGNPATSVKLNYSDKDNYERYIYKVDVGVSRGFDELNQFAETQEEEKSFIGSRVPQVLEISDTIKIIRSTIKNARIHHPREYYETNIINKNYTDLLLDNPYYTSPNPPIPGTPSGIVPQVSTYESERKRKAEEEEEEQWKQYYIQNAIRFSTTPEIFKKAYIYAENKIKREEYIDDQAYRQKRIQVIKDFIEADKKTAELKQKYMKYKAKYLKLKNN